MSTYTFQLPNFANESDYAEQALRSMDSVSGVNVDKAAETITVTSSLSHSEMLDAIRRQGVAAK